MKLRNYFSKLGNKYWKAKSNYIKYYDKLKINEKTILLESQHGKELAGNIFYILKYLAENEQYQEYQIFLSVYGIKNETKIREFLDNRGYTKVSLLVFASDEYYRIAASAKYLINDNTFWPFFIKKQGQIYLNTWHGTPLKTLGKNITNNPVSIGNAQKNFITSDYLLFPNKYTQEHMIEDYMLENITTNTKTIQYAYPRNEVFFDDLYRQRIREELQIDDKYVYAYMPTFRGLHGNQKLSKSDFYFMYYLYELDNMLLENEVLFLKMHIATEREVVFDDFKHIQKFPETYETYEILNAADVLITDYSSVLFDFACSKRKIVLFPYDMNYYLEDRGTYLSLDELPFPKVFTLEDLVSEIRVEKKYDETEFLDKFCPYDNKDAAKHLCDFLILHKQNGITAKAIPDNAKENVMLYAGNLAPNGVTSSLKALLDNLDLDKRNYYLTFCQGRAWGYGNQLSTFPDKVGYFAMAGWFNLSFVQKAIRVLFERKIIPARMFAGFLKKREMQNLNCNYGGARIDTIIQFNGYDDDVMIMYSFFKGDKYIYVHSNMEKEIKIRGNARKDVLRYIYANYDCVMPVTEAIVPPMKKLLKHSRHIKVCKNLINYKKILSQSELPIVLDTKSECSIPFSDLLDKLSSTGPKFINIGRFSPEKGHERLINAFCKIKTSQPDALLFIMGGNSYGDNYQVLLENIEHRGLKDSVILLLNISNPYPILKACNYFVLSSFYEGFGLVLAEADILKKPVISTDIDGPRDFMTRHGGTLVENSEEGIYQGMKLLLAGKVNLLKVDYEEYNKECIREFEQVFSINP